MHTPIRRDGFAGQHMVVVPPPVRAAAAKHPLLRGLLVTDAGYFPRAEGHRVERPQGSSTHLLIICLKGQGWAKSAGRSVVVSAGEAIWLPSEQPHAYGAGEEDPWTIVWAHFTGAEVADWQEQIGWAAKGPIGFLDFSDQGAATLGLDRVYAALESGYSVQHLLTASTALRGVFCATFEAMIRSGPTKSSAERTAAVREQMIENPARAYRLDELAAGAGLSVPHFCLLFRKQTGFAPIDFLIRQRIRRACQLLDRNHGTVAEIAAEVGFDDAYYFSRCFRRIMGSSPREYRKSIKG